MSKVAAIIRVRMGSERLPGKALREVEGKPLLGHLFDRIRRARTIDDIVVATSVQSDNDPIEHYCRQRGIACFRGSEDDVLGRMIGALESVKADVGVEIYGDSFLCDPALIDEVVTVFQSDLSFDLVGNDIVLTYPSGMLVEAFSINALRNARKQTHDPEMLEHGTRFIRLHPDIFAIKNIEAVESLRRPELHLDVDTMEDLQLIRAIFAHFAPRNDMSLEEIIAYLDMHPNIRDGNKDVSRRWKQSIEKSASSYTKKQRENRHT